MYSMTIESKYPLNFREEDAITLGTHLRHRHSVNIIGMKRVGISNFLRFFLSHSDVVKTYIKDSEKHVFILVDLNDLVEREILPFWILTLKRIVDTLETLEIPGKQKRKIEGLFLKAIQLQDHFLAVDSVRQALAMLIDHNFLPTLFLLHFDRIKEAVSPAFFDNLEGLLNETGNKLSYVFTSYRSLDQLSPDVFSQNSLPFFNHNMYLAPASKKDMEIIVNANIARSKLAIPASDKEALYQFAAGHIQYLQLSLLIMREHADELATEKLFDMLIHDERINLQSEELWDSLSDREREVFMKIIAEESMTEKDRKDAQYLWDTMFIHTVPGKEQVFSPFLKAYVENGNSHLQSQVITVHFSKKENALYQLLEQHLGEICERDAIISSVWPEYGEVGISDWAIDRLVARVRTKLRQQKSKYEIKTIRTRGYQLVEK